MSSSSREPSEVSRLLDNQDHRDELRKVTTSDSSFRPTVVIRIDEFFRFRYWHGMFDSVLLAFSTAALTLVNIDTLLNRIGSGLFVACCFLCLYTRYATNDSMDAEDVKNRLAWQRVAQRNRDQENNDNEYAIVGHTSELRILQGISRHSPMYSSIQHTSILLVATGLLVTAGWIIYASWAEATSLEAIKLVFLTGCMAIIAVVYHYGARVWGNSCLLTEGTGVSSTQGKFAIADVLRARFRTRDFFALQEILPLCCCEDDDEAQQIFEGLASDFAQLGFDLRVEVGPHSKSRLRTTTMNTIIVAHSE
eukprot:GEZU01005194.1.p1 GENE.GEZU01005194.1~~GEZU01005194.1.p1  ORF type:complete len:308 (-),score=35.92 GEZU01005194.1:31-954(-)